MLIALILLFHLGVFPMIKLMSVSVESVWIVSHKSRTAMVIGYLFKHAPLAVNPRQMLSTSSLTYIPGFQWSPNKIWCYQTCTSTRHYRIHEGERETWHTISYNRSTSCSEFQSFSTILSIICWCCAPWLLLSASFFPTICLSLISWKLYT